MDDLRGGRRPTRRQCRGRETAGNTGKMGPDAGQRWTDTRPGAGRAAPPAHVRETESELVSALKSHIATLKTYIERLTAELVTELERADRGITELADERTARQTDQEQLAAARAAADKATAELVELARRLAAIAETQTSAEAEPEPPRRKLGRAWGWFLRN